MNLFIRRTIRRIVIRIKFFLYSPDFKKYSNQGKREKKVNLYERSTGYFRRRFFCFRTPSNQQHQKMWDNNDDDDDNGIVLFETECGDYTDIGTRPTNEDTHLVVSHFRSFLDACTEYKRASLYAVFDGHGGKEVSKVLEKDFEACLIANFKQFERSALYNKEYAEIEAAFEMVFKNQDERLKNATSNTKEKSGSTAAVVLILDGILFVTNVGDAEVVLGYSSTEDQKGCRAKVLTSLHKATIESEVARVKAAGGKVFFGRVGGSLAVTRAFGDFGFKLPKNIKYHDGTDDFVSVVPHLSIRPLNKLDRVLIVACDGLWDTVTYQKAVELAIHWRRQGYEAEEIAKKLSSYALKKIKGEKEASKDNVTIIVVFLDWFSQSKDAIDPYKGTIQKEKEEEPESNAEQSHLMLVEDGDHSTTSVESKQSLHKHIRGPELSTFFF